MKFGQSNARNSVILGTTADGPVGIILLVRFRATAVPPTLIDRTIRTPLSAATGVRELTKPPAPRISEYEITDASEQRS